MPVMKGKSGWQYKIQCISSGDWLLITIMNKSILKMFWKYIPDYSWSFWIVFLLKRGKNWRLLQLDRHYRNFLIPPLQIGLAEKHHESSSWFLIDTHYHLGFCLYYSEVQRFDRHAFIINVTYRNSHFGWWKFCLQLDAKNLDMDPTDTYSTYIPHFVS